MRNRLSACLCVALAAVGVLCISTSEASAQAAAPAGTSAGKGTGPRTPWGHPDLQGIWNNATTTPLERMTADEQARGGGAMAAVREATDGTGAGWPERGASSRGVARRRSARRTDPDDRGGQSSGWCDRENARAARGRGRLVAGPQLLGALHLANAADGDDPELYNANYQILQTPDHVVILVEMIHEARIIPLDGRPHARSRIRQWLGDSRGSLGGRHARRRNHQLQRQIGWRRLCSRRT